MAELSDQAFVLKHRLVGAAVLLLFAIIVLPQILTGPNRQIGPLSSNRGAELPKVQPTFESRITINDDQEIGSHLATKKGKQGPRGDTTMSQNLVSKPASAKNPTPDKKLAGWVVRVGVFQDAENARKRSRLLIEHGFDVKTEERKLGGKTATRVFIGPYRSQAEADKERARVVMVINDRAFVIPYP